MNPEVFSAGPQIASVSENLEKSLNSNQVGDMQHSNSKRLEDDSVQFQKTSEHGKGVI